MANEPKQGRFRFNAGKKYKYRGPHPASKEAKAHTKAIDEYIAKYVLKTKPITPAQPTTESKPPDAPPAAKPRTPEEEAARKKYLAELADWENM